MGPRGQAPSVDVRELEPTPAELAPEESVFLNQIGDRLALAT